MMRRSTSAAILTATALLFAIGHSHGQSPRLYKWVDEHGNVHYSDRVEGEAAANDVQRINSAGMKVDTQHSAVPKTRAEELQHQQARRTAQRDTMLLASYRSEIELLRAHDQSRAAIEDSIRAAEGNIARLRQELANRQGTPSEQTPADAEIERLRKQVADEQAQVEQLEARRFELHERQNEEIARFRELTTHNS